MCTFYATKCAFGAVLNVMNWGEWFPLTSVITPAQHRIFQNDFVADLTGFSAHAQINSPLFICN